MSKALRFVDFFAGCGGFRTAFEREGFKCVAFCEIDKHATKLYKAYYNTKNEVYYNDATTVEPEHMPDFDIFTGGFPCQAFSIAGKRQGFEDTRGTLFFEIARICKVKQPKYIVLENVKGLLNHDNGRTFATILRVLTDIGYSVEWQVLNSKFFGVPQNRERVFIVGHLRGKCEQKIFPIKKERIEYSETDKTEKLVYWKNSQEKWVEEERNNVPTLKTQSELCRQTLLVTNVNPSGRGQNGNVYDIAGISPTLTTNKGEGIKIGTLRTHKDGNGFREIADSNCPTIPARAREDGSGQPVVAIPVLTPDRLEKRQNGRRFKENQEPMFTLTGQDRHGVMLVKEATKKGYQEATLGDGINLSFPESETRRGRVQKEIAPTLDTYCNIGTVSELTGGGGAPI